MKYSWILILFLIAIVICEGSAQYLIKRSRIQNDITLCLLAVGLYIFVVALLYTSYAYVPMAPLTAMWSALSIISVSLIGTLIFHEKLNIIDYFGFGLIVLGIILVFFAN